MNGTLTAETKHDLHMFAPFAFPKKMPDRIKIFDRLTFIPMNAREKCGTKKTCTCSGIGSVFYTLIKVPITASQNLALNLALIFLLHGHN